MKIEIAIVSVLLITPAFLPVFSIFYAEETRVCGMDNINYPNKSYAQKNNIQISYDFPCEFPKGEEGLFERREDIEFVGMLLDFLSDGSRSLFTIRSNFDNKEYLVINEAGNEVERFIPGDQLKIIGEVNKNTEIIHSYDMENLSASELVTDNCIIKSLDLINESIVCKKNDESNSNFSYDVNSRFVAGFINRANPSDFQIDDKVRVRYDKNFNIKTLLLSERAGVNYLESHILVSDAVLLSINEEAAFIEVELLGKDEGQVVHIEIQEDVNMVKKYFGKITLKDFTVNDHLYIVGKVNDDGSHQAALIKNKSVWR